MASEPEARFTREAETKVRVLKPPRSRILRKAGYAVHLFHPPTVTALDLWLGGDRQEALSHAMTVLHAEAKARASGEAEAEAVIVRQYQFGLGTKVRDLRTGRTTSKVDKVLQGRLDLFF